MSIYKYIGAMIISFLWPFDRKAKIAAFNLEFYNFIYYERGLNDILELYFSLPFLGD